MMKTNVNIVRIFLKIPDSELPAIVHKIELGWVGGSNST